MAVINPLLGRMKGKYGGSVMYSNGGKQCMRERIVEVRNPRTAKQAIQRAIAATVAKFVSAFAPVLNNSLQSEQTKVKTLAKIRGMNMNMLRQLAAAGDGNYCPKGAMFVAPNEYFISRGTLAGITPSKQFSLEFLATRGAVFFDISQVNVEEVNSSVTASKVFPTIAVGDQITVMASFMEDVSEGSHSAYCRFAFKDNTTQALLVDGEYPKLNPAAIDLTKADGDWQSLRFSFVSDAQHGDGSLMFVGGMLGDNNDGPLPLASVGVIVSREAGKLRSNARMVSVADPEYSLADVYPTYMDGGTAIDMPSENYLDNDADVTNYFAHLPSALPYAVTLAEDARSLVKLTTNIPLDASPQISLTITRDGGTNTEVLNYGGSKVGFQEVQVEVQWLSNGYLAIQGTQGTVNITAGNIQFIGGSVQLN